MPWTNNASEQAIKGPKRHQAVSGFLHTLATLTAHCRVRSYLASSRGHGITPIDAIHAALAGNHGYQRPSALNPLNGHAYGCCNDRRTHPGSSGIS